MSVQRMGLEKEREAVRAVGTAVDEAMWFSWEMEWKTMGPFSRW
jgi:hypothetical protein